LENKIVVIGSLNMDLVACAPRIPVVGETIVGHTYFSEPGGKGANQAFAAARLGGRVAMAGRVGDDDFGRQMRTNLEQAGCDVGRLLQVANCTSGIALIFVADDGPNSIIIVPGANDRFSPEDVRAEVQYLGHPNVVLLQLENPLPTVLEAARLGRRLGSRVVLDPAPAQPVPEELFALIDVWTPNETEAAILSGLPPSRLDAAQAVRVAQSLRDRGAKTVIVKLGDQGCLLVEEGKSQHLLAPKVKAVDTTAAGDVFNGALAVALSESQEMAAACAQACAPTRDELSAFTAV
jgi:ribokinase